MQHADICVNPLGKSLGEYVHHRNHDEEGEKDDRRRDHDAANERMARRGRGPGRSGRLSVRRQRFRHEPVLVSKMRSMRVAPRALPHVARSRRPVHHSRPLIASNTRSEKNSKTMPIAVASEVRKSSSLVTICKGAICDLPGIFPAMKITEPYSPIARAKANANPLSQAGKISGKITRRKIVDLLAPRLNAACSYSVSQSRSTGWTVRTTKGSPTNIRTSTIPVVVLEYGKLSHDRASADKTSPNPASPATTLMERATWRPN